MVKSILSESIDEKTCLCEWMQFNEIGSLVQKKTESQVSCTLLQEGCVSGGFMIQRLLKRKKKQSCEQQRMHEYQHCDEAVPQECKKKLRLRAKFVNSFQTFNTSKNYYVHFIHFYMFLSQERKRNDTITRIFLPQYA